MTEKDLYQDIYVCIYAWGGKKCACAFKPKVWQMLITDMMAEQERHTALRLHPCRLLLPCSCPGITANCELCRSAYGPI